MIEPGVRIQLGLDRPVDALVIGESWVANILYRRRYASLLSGEKAMAYFLGDAPGYGMILVDASESWAASMTPSDRRVGGLGLRYLFESGADSGRHFFFFTFPSSEFDRGFLFFPFAF